MGTRFARRGPARPLPHAGERGSFKLPSRTKQSDPRSGGALADLLHLDLSAVRRRREELPLLVQLPADSLVLANTIVCGPASNEIRGSWKDGDNLIGLQAVT